MVPKEEKKPDEFIKIDYLRFDNKNQVIELQNQSGKNRAQSQLSINDSAMEPKDMKNAKSYGSLVTPG